MLVRKWNILNNWFSDELNDYQSYHEGKGTVPRITKLKTGIQRAYYLARVNEKSFLFQFSLSNIFFPKMCGNASLSKWRN